MHEPYQYSRQKDTFPGSYAFFVLDNQLVRTVDCHGQYFHLFLCQTRRLSVIPSPRAHMVTLCYWLSVSLLVRLIPSQLELVTDALSL